MKIPVSNQKSQAQFNVTPLIDIIFLLIIFFLVSSHFVHNDVLEEVELPAGAGIADEENPSRLVVTITADEKLHVGGKVVEHAEIEAMILAGHERHPENYEVHIRADRRVPFKLAEPVLRAAARAGVTRIRFPVTLRPDDSATP